MRYFHRDSWLGNKIERPVNHGPDAYSQAFPHFHNPMELVTRVEWLGETEPEAPLAGENLLYRVTVKLPLNSVGELLSGFWAASCAHELLSVEEDHVLLRFKAQAVCAAPPHGERCLVLEEYVRATTGKEVVDEDAAWDSVPAWVEDHFCYGSINDALFLVHTFEEEVELSFMKGVDPAPVELFLEEAGPLGEASNEALQDSAYESMGEMEPPLVGVSPRGERVRVLIFPHED